MLRSILLLSWFIIASSSQCQRKENKRILNDRISESSGLEFFPAWSDCLITHNDSGHKPKIFMVKQDGSNCHENWKKGVNIINAENRDWEDISWRESDSTLVIADIGDNAHQHKSVHLYLIKPFELSENQEELEATEIKCKYPKKKKNKNYHNAEAFCCIEDGFMIITKDYNETRFFVGQWKEEQDDKIPLDQIAKFDLNDKITAADYNFSNNQLVVLGYNNVFIYRLDSQGNDQLKLLKQDNITMGQCEAVAWIDNHTIMITNENRDIFEIDTNTLK